MSLELTLQFYKIYSSVNNLNTPNYRELGGLKLFQILATFYQILMVRRKPFKGVTQIFTMLRQIFIVLPNLLWCHSGETLELLR
ncbi:hypothetical protein NIES4071_06920 [Calothrix sp. NIES-4071]|nr:hypothetical protein NIES4071_06920 [Calothrix sp. NIES-4071]BAZ55034.1 hypothetical protein NIES4105_06880 [Calothrix sp. NIES-4105]